MFWGILSNSCYVAFFVMCLYSVLELITILIIKIISQSNLLSLTRKCRKQIIQESFISSTAQQCCLVTWQVAGPWLHRLVICTQFCISQFLNSRKHVCHVLKIKIIINNTYFSLLYTGNEIDCKANILHASGFCVVPLLAIVNICCSANEYF